MKEHGLFNIIFQRFFKFVKTIEKIKIRYVYLYRLLRNFCVFVMQDTKVLFYY